MKYVVGSFSLVVLLFSCGLKQETTPQSQATPVNEDVIVDGESDAVTAVEVNGAEASGYTFLVTIESGDEGCDRYTNWWEVVTEDGALLYRRILAHSHVDEQPFTRSGGPVVVDANDVLIVRSHTYPTGYSARAMQGNIAEGFAPVTLAPEFATALAEAEPQPNGCAF